MTLQFHNTASRKVETFQQSGDTVRLYTCGPTVYDYPHIGNWAAYIYWDVLVRVLKANGLNVDRVMNITDVGHLTGDNEGDPNIGEDKLEKGARREGKTAWEIADFYTKDFMLGMEQLGLITPDHIAKATDYINEQLELVRTLKQKGFTYQISDGIYFDTAKFPRYSDFAHLNTEELKAGARVGFNPEKRNATDFALWKFTPENTKRDMEWDTPADLLDGAASRKGFPGWHVECSAIAMNFLGNTLDIHTGGIDHIPVHHTNEIAQSEAASGQAFSRYWLHNNHMKVDGSKISKSLGNGYTLETLKERGFSPLDFRLLVLQSHYQSEANFSFESLQASKNRLAHWRNVAALRWQTNEKGSDEIQQLLELTPDSLLSTLNNNLNTPEALRLIDETFDAIESSPLDDIPSGPLTKFISAIDNLLGLQLLDSTPNIDESSEQLIKTREIARKNSDFAKSDELRDELISHGIGVKDTAHGSVWSYVK